MTEKQKSKASFWVLACLAACALFIGFVWMKSQDTSKLGGVQKAKQNLLGRAVPSIQKASWDPSVYVGERGSQTGGVEITALIENPRLKPISDIKFVIEQRQKNRTVPIASSIVKWPIPGGVEHGVVEPVTVFVPNGEIKRQSGCDLPNGCKLYIAILSIDYYNNDLTSETVSDAVLIEVTGPTKPLPTPEEDANAGLFLKDEPAAKLKDGDDRK